jgi:FtsP/CotA-like multicopper oxidase with cupredoxin domain
VDRRDFIKMGGLGALASTGLLVPLTTVTAKAASALSDRDFPKRYTYPFRRPPVLKPYKPNTKDSYGRTVENYVVTARPARAKILERLETPIYAYNGMFPGPTIQVQQGTAVTMRVRNKLPVTNPISGESFATSTHLHGSASLPQFDGYANDVTSKDQRKDYSYPNSQDARTLWYHDHGVHRTAENVYAGLAAQYQLHDVHEREQLPQGEFDVPIVLSDAMFAADGRLAFDDHDDSGLWGDVVLVNGVPWPVMQVKRRVYRFRVLNASVSRSYRPALSNGQPLTIVATDGGMVPKTQAVTTYRHAPAERYEFLVDFSKYARGTVIHLINRSNPNNRDYDHTNKIMRFVVTDGAFDPTNNTVPTELDIGAHASATMALASATPKRRRSMRVHRDDVTNAWLLNDTSWHDVEVSGFSKVFANPAVDDVEQWSFENRGGGWFHPMHVHLVDFVVVGRNTNGGKPFPWELGPKDTVYVGEGETVRVMMKFEVTKGATGGRYMIHCHNLPHEDHDMMVQYRVGRDDASNDPLGVDPVADPHPAVDPVRYPERYETDPVGSVDV